MNSEFYRISNSQASADRLRSIAAEAEKTGRRGDVVRAARWIVEELERTPLELGESRNALQHIELQMRLAFVGPLQVLFGVHEPSRTVFISRMSLRKNR